MFRNGAKQTILTADVAITTVTDDFAPTAGSEFATTISVDVTLALADTDYKSYAYSMDVAGLPNWLKVVGEISSSDSVVKGEYHHEITLSGTPENVSEAVSLTLSAMVKLSEASANEDLVCVVDKTITLKVLSPDITTDVTSETPSDSGGTSGSPSSGSTDAYSNYNSNNTGTTTNGGSTQSPSDSGSDTETPSDGGSTESPGNSEQPSNTETPSSNTNITGNETPTNTESPSNETPSNGNETPSSESPSSESPSSETTGNN